MRPKTVIINYYSSDHLLSRNIKKKGIDWHLEASQDKSAILKLKILMNKSI